MSQMVAIPHLQSTIQAYLTLPPSGKGPGLLFCHAWWGLTDTFKELADRLAAAGFVVLAPDMYHGVVATTIEDAGKFGGQADERGSLLEAEVIAAADYLAQLSEVDGSQIGVIGYSFGAHYALNASEQRPEVIKAVVLYYGTGGWSFDAAQAAYQGHFAEEDEWEDAATIEEFAGTLESAERPYEYFVYPNTHHWFAEPNRPEYVSEAAELAEARTIAFFRQHLG